MDTSLRLMSMETGNVREYLYDMDEHLLWVTDFAPDLTCMAKRWYEISWNPIDRIRLKAMGQQGVNLTDDEGLDIDE